MKFSDENGHTRHTHKHGAKALLVAQIAPEYPGRETHHDELPSLLGRCSACFSSAEKDPLASAAFFFDDRITTKGQLKNVPRLPRTGCCSSSNFGRGSTASPFLQLRRQELSSVRSSPLSQAQTACVFRPLGVKSPLRLTQSRTNTCTSASGEYSGKRTNIKNGYRFNVETPGACFRCSIVSLVFPLSAQQQTSRCLCSLCCSVVVLGTRCPQRCRAHPLLQPCASG